MNINNNNVTFHSVISSIQKVALYETKTVSKSMQTRNLTGFTPDFILLFLLISSQIV